MNEWKQLENRLRSWKPRGPSPKVKTRLFGQPIIERAAVASPSWPMLSAGTTGERWEFTGWHWLVPAMAACMLALLVFGRGPAVWSPFPSPAPTSLMATVALSSPNLATYVLVASHSPHNACPTATLEWTNGSLSLTTPALMRNTNGLIQ